ncbi:MAG TPA: hypothetical protein PLI48_04140 [Gammaproteobacteria bacterium]|nr:hypothetical protein [Gammaproteobacteria bacterium]HRP88292.1 hypothetical protein [Gammaproteobacteria bacterium]
MNDNEPDRVPDRVPVSGTRKGPGARLVVLYGAAVLFLLAALGLEKPRSLIELTLRDLRDVFYLGFAALVILELTALVGRRWIRKRSLYYLVAVVAMLAMVFGFELLADSDPEQPERWIRNLVGAFGFLALSAALDRGLKREHAWLRGWPRRSIGIAGALCMLTALHPLVPVSASYAGRAGAFPVVVDLASLWQEPFIDVQGAELFVGKGPEEWSRRAGRRVALLLFDGTPGGGVTVREPFKDWSGMSVMLINVYSTAPQPVRMILRLEDSSRLLPPDERIDYALRIVPGANDFFIPLEALSTAPSGRSIDLTSIRRMGLYLGEPADPLRIYVHRIRMSEQ